MTKGFKYTGIDRSNESYCFESFDQYWTLEVFQKIEDEFGLPRIHGVALAGEHRGYLFSFNGYEIRLWGWNPEYCKPSTGLWGQMGEYNVFKYLPKFVRELIQEAHQNLKSNPNFYT
jgi:phage tail sheath protein FI